MLKRATDVLINLSTCYCSPLLSLRAIILKNYPSRKAT